MIRLSCIVLAVIVTLTSTAAFGQMRPLQRPTGNNQQIILPTTPQPNRYRGRFPDRSPGTQQQTGTTMLVPSQQPKTQKIDAAISTNGQQVELRSSGGNLSQKSGDGSAEGSYKVLQRDDTFNLKVYHQGRIHARTGSTSTEYLFVVVDKQGEKLWSYKHNHSIGADAWDGWADKVTNEMAVIPSGVGRKIARNEAVIGFVVTCNRSHSATLNKLCDQLKEAGINVVKAKLSGL